MSIKSIMPTSHLILCHPLLLPPSTFPSIKVFSNESVLCIRWPKYWSFSFSISPSFSSLRMDWLDLLAIQGTLRVFSSTTVRKRHVFSAQPSLWLRKRVGKLSKAPQLVQTLKPHEFWVKQSGSRGCALTHHTWLSRATKFSSQVPKIG